jgi:hypothetical protein
LLAAFSRVNHLRKRKERREREKRKREREKERKERDQRGMLHTVQQGCRRRWRKRRRK